MNSLSENDTKAVVKILIEQLGIEESQVTPEARIIEDLNADSLDVMEILMAVEEQFKLSIPDDVSERVSTVGELIELLQEMLEQQ
jgi:acyl carrier protein